MRSVQLPPSEDEDLDDDDLPGVLINEFEFFRPFKPPESEDMVAMKARRRQISDMITMEKARLEKAPERTRKNIQLHLAFLEKSLKQVDKDLVEEGDTVVSSGILHELTDEFKGRELSLEEMNEVADVVTIAYQERGYILARAYVPEQEIEDGVLKIAIVEGDIGEINVSGNKYYHDRVIRRNFMEQLRHGVIREELLEKGLLMTKELPEAETRIVLEKGEESGTANLSLKAEDKIAFKASMDFNNFGLESIGQERFGLNMEITDPWWGSTLNLRGVSGQDRHVSALGSADLSIPVNSYGTRLSFKYMKGLYAVGQDLADLGLEGTTYTHGVGISQPIWRTRNKSLTMSVGYDRKYSEGYLMGEINSIDDVDLYYTTLDFDSLDRFLGKNIASIGYYDGSYMPNGSYGPSRSNAAEDFVRYNINLARIQKIYGNINIMVRGSGQYSNDRLLPMEQMAIGGYGTVRGHDPALFLGDTGYTMSAEVLTAPPYLADKVIFGQRVAQIVQLAFFWDRGRVSISEPEQGEFRRLTGYGAGIRLYYKDLFSFKFDYALPSEEMTANERPAFYYFMGSINLTSGEVMNWFKKEK